MHSFCWRGCAWREQSFIGTVFIVSLCDLLRMG